MVDITFPNINNIQITPNCIWVHDKLTIFEIYETQVASSFIGLVWQHDKKNPFSILNSCSSSSLSLSLFRGKSIIIMTSSWFCSDDYVADGGTDLHGLFFHNDDFVVSSFLWAWFWNGLSCYLLLFDSTVSASDSDLHKSITSSYLILLDWSNHFCQE